MTMFFKVVQVVMALIADGTALELTLYYSSCVLMGIGGAHIYTAMVSCLLSPPIPMFCARLIRSLCILIVHFSRSIQCAVRYLPSLHSLRVYSCHCFPYQFPSLIVRR